MLSKFPKPTPCGRDFALLASLTWVTAFVIATQYENLPTPMKMHEDPQEGLLPNARKSPTNS